MEECLRYLVAGKTCIFFVSSRETPMVRAILQVLGIIVLLLALTLITLKLKHQNADGPSVLFPGGELVSGEVYEGPEPDWSFTDDVFVIELQTHDPVSSRRIFVMESDGKVYVPSGYMRSFLGRLWKDWAFNVEDGNKLVVARINGVRYERELVRVNEPTVVDGVAKKLAEKYSGDASPEIVAELAQSVIDGDTWIFEMGPRSQ